MAQMAFFDVRDEVSHFVHMSFGERIHQQHGTSHPLKSPVCLVPYLNSWMAVDSASRAFSPSTSFSRSVALASRVNSA